MLQKSFEDTDCDVLSEIDTHLNPSEESDCNDPSAANLILASLQSLGDAALTAARTAGWQNLLELHCTCIAIISFPELLQ